MVGRDVFGWNYTTVLDVVALVGFAVLYWLYRNRERFGGGAGYAKDPVCGMQVEIAHAPATAHPRRRDVLLLLRPLPRTGSTPTRRRFAAGGGEPDGSPTTSTPRPAAGRRRTRCAA